VLCKYKEIYSFFVPLPKRYLSQCGKLLFKKGTKQEMRPSGELKGLTLKHHNAHTKDRLMPTQSIGAGQTGEAALRRPKNIHDEIIKQT